MLLLLQYSYAFFHIGYAGLLSYYVFYSSTTCATYSLLPFCLFISIFGHFHLQCPTFQHLKYFIFFILSYHLISTLSLTSYCITLVTNILYLFWNFSLFSFFSSFLVLQLQIRYLNFLQLQYSLSLLLSNCALSKMRAHFSLSILFRRLLYYC